MVHGNSVLQWISPLWSAVKNNKYEKSKKNSGIESYQIN